MCMTLFPSKPILLPQSQPLGTIHQGTHESTVDLLADSLQSSRTWTETLWDPTPMPIITWFWWLKLTNPGLNKYAAKSNWKSSAIFRCKHFQKNMLKPPASNSSSEVVDEKLNHWPTLRRKKKIRPLVAEITGSLSLSWSERSSWPNLNLRESNIVRLAICWGWWCLKYFEMVSNVQWPILLILSRPM